MTATFAASLAKPALAHVTPADASLLSTMSAELFLRFPWRLNFLQDVEMAITRTVCHHADSQTVIYPHGVEVKLFGKGQTPAVNVLNRGLPVPSKSSRNGTRGLRVASTRPSERRHVAGCRSKCNLSRVLILSVMGDARLGLNRSQINLARYLMAEKMRLVQRLQDQQDADILQSPSPPDEVS